MTNENEKMKEITYIIGDATQPAIRKGEYSVICHCCNTLGAWGRGFVIPLGNRFPNAKLNYQKFIKSTPADKRLGQVSCEKVSSNIIVANIMGQERIYKTKDGKIPLDYDALRKGFEGVIDRMKLTNVPFTIHMPRIGCGLAGGDWNIVENIIKEVFGEKDIEVFVYDFN